MTTEEKAKAYDEALKWMRKLYPGLHGATKEDAEHYFPELRESEDERIRKAIIELLKEVEEDETYTGRQHIPDMLAYLEKQKEHHVPWYDYQKSKDAGYTIVPNGEYEQLIKQKEQKPADKEQDSITFLEQHGYTIVPPHAPVSIVPSSKAIVTEWSEEDKRAVNDAIVSLSEMANGEIPHLLPSMLLEVVERLKSLHPQPQGTYKLIVHNIYEMLKDKDFFDIPPSHRVSLLNDIRVRCKNADEQAEILDVHSWKPSEEQMGALSWMIENARANIDLDPLKDLYEQLKKL